MNTIDFNNYLFNNTTDTDSKYLSALTPITKRINVFSFFFGGGKTQISIEHIKETKKKFYYIGHTRSLVSDTQKRFVKEGIECRTHLAVKKEKLLSESDENIFLCLESLPSLFPNQRGYNTLNELRDRIFIFDEFVAIMNQLNSGMNNHRRALIVSCLEWVLKNCKCFIFDALLDKHEIEYILRFVDKNKQDEFELFSNSGYIPPKRNTHFIYNKDKFIYSILNSKDVPLILTDVKRFGNDIIRDIGDSRKCNILSSDTRGDILEKHKLDEFVEMENLDLLVITPTGFEGLSIEHKFNAIYLYIGNEGIQDYRRYIQAIHRERNFEIPIYIHSSKPDGHNPLNTEYTDFIDVLLERDKQSNKLNDLSLKYLNENGFYETRKEFANYEQYAAKQKLFCIELSKLGIYNYIENYYKQFDFEVIKDLETMEIIIEKSDSESIDEKRDRLKSIPLVDKNEYDKLKIERATRDLKKDEKEIMNKFELAENLGLGYTDVNRENAVNSIYDITVNEFKINRIVERLGAANDIQKRNEYEKDLHNKMAVNLNPKSLAIETAIVKKFINDFRGKSFSKTDIDMVIIQDLLTATNKKSYLGKDEFSKAIMKTSGYYELLKISEWNKNQSLVFDYCKAIAEGDNETIYAVYGKQISEQLNKIEKKLDASKKSAIERARSKTKNKKTLASNIEKINHRYNEVSPRKLLIAEMKIIESIKSKFAVSPMQIISEILSDYGITLERTFKNGKRAYKMNLEFFDRFSLHNEQSIYKKLDSASVVETCQI